MSHARTKRITEIALSVGTISLFGAVLLIEIFFSGFSRLLFSMIETLRNFRFDVIIRYIPYFFLGMKGEISGLILTLYLAIVSIGFAFLTGLLFGIMRTSARWWVKYPAVAYIEVIRGMPLILVIFWFVMLPSALVDNPRALPSRIYFAIFAFICFSGAYMAEIVRAGILSIGKGQMEAARSTGLTHAQAMTYIILPQALKNMIPSFVNQFVSLIKDTSLVWFVGLAELTTTIFQINNKELVAPMELYLFGAVVYFFICYPLTSASRKLEERLGVGKR